VTVFIAVFAGVFGALFGSFANVVIYRVPRKESVVSPPSHCPNCGAGIRARDNVPVIGWLVLRGKCRDCGNPISARYPLVEAATAIALVLVALRFAPAIEAAATPALAWSAALVFIAFAYLAVISIILTLIDIDVHRLPNLIVLPAYGVGALLLGIASVLSGDFTALAVAAAGAGALFALYLIAALVYPGGMGFGDVKLAGVLGLFLGYLGVGNLVVGAFAPFVLGGVFAVVLLLLKRAGRKSGIPFGPWMILGTWVGVATGAPIFVWYLGLFGL